MRFLAFALVFLVAPTLAFSQGGAKVKSSGGRVRTKKAGSAVRKHDREYEVKKDPKKAADSSAAQADGEDEPAPKPATIDFSKNPNPERPKKRN